MQEVSIYLETSIRGLNKTIGWYGYIVEYIDSHGREHTRGGCNYKMGVTPNMLILTAFCAALDELKKGCRIRVYTDNAYLRESCERRLIRWRENGWKTAHKEPIRNMALWQQVSEKISVHVIRFGTEEDPDYKGKYRDQIGEEIERRKAENAV